jgi:hypothetical protein
MVKQGFGHIVNTSSILGLVAMGTTLTQGMPLDIFNRNELKFRKKVQ